jgi:hypothetical protein
MRKVVGIDRKIKRAWVDAVLDRLTQTTDETELRTFLDSHLKDELPGKESRAKATGIILRIWSGIPSSRLPLRDRAVAMLPRISGQERIWLHWGMTALAYPFFRDTAEVVGRLLALQDDFTTAQVQGRMLTAWGDRATSKEAAQKLITTLVDWEVLRSTKTKGHFLLARKMTASITELQLWLLEALLGASAADEIEAHQLLRLPESFPFTLSIGIADLRKYEAFNIHRQGLDMDMVALRQVKLVPPPKHAKRAKKKKTTRADHASLFDMKSEEVISNNGKPVSAQAVHDHQGGLNERQWIKEPIKSEVYRPLDVFQLKAGRYLLYLDILGFKDIVQTRTPSEVYQIVDKVVAEFRKRGDSIRDFRTLYFSDTIIFYQEPVGWGSWAFADIYAIAGMAWSALAAHGIPCRGAISFGEFHVELDSNQQHSIFFGKALIEAYETESAPRNSEWIGISLCSSAWQAVEYMEPGLVDILTTEGRWLRHHDCLRLNPFMTLRGAFQDHQIGEITCDLSEWDAPDFPSDVKALSFILDTAEAFQANQDTGRIAVKYRYTARLLTELLGAQCVEWTKQAARGFTKDSI